MADKCRPYKGKYNIVLYTMDESICYPFINPIELAKWIYKNPGKKELTNIRTKLHRIRIIKSCNSKRRCCIVANSVKYEVELVKAN